MAQIPLWLQMSFSGIVLIGSLMMPETPRWLMANDRHEEALAVSAYDINLTGTPY